MADELKKIVREELEFAKKRLEAAEILLNNNMIEDSINRIYYSLLHAAKSMLNVLGYDAKTYVGIISEFGLRIIKEKLIEKKFGRVLRKAFEMRESSDYKISVVFEREEVEELLKEAKDFLKMAEKFVKLRL